MTEHECLLPLPGRSGGRNRDQHQCKTCGQWYVVKVNQPNGVRYWEEVKNYRTRRQRGLR